MDSITGSPVNPSPSVFTRPKDRVLPKHHVMGRVIKPHLKYEKKYRPELASHRTDKPLDYTGVGFDSTAMVVEQPVSRDKNQFEKDMDDIGDIYVAMLKSKSHQPMIGWWRFLVVNSSLFSLNSEVRSQPYAPTWMGD